jgi:ribosomal protein S18 acetylase RimI-like enzyme
VIRTGIKKQPTGLGKQQFFETRTSSRRIEGIGFVLGRPVSWKVASAIPELYRIYTLSRTHGSGLGTQLMQAAIGGTPAYLWVLEDNPRARAFYRKSESALMGRARSWHGTGASCRKYGWSADKTQRHHGAR